MAVAGQDAAGSVEVTHNARGARVGREWLAVELSGLLPPAMVTDAVVVGAELLGNAVRHAAPLPGGVIRLAWDLAASTAGVQLRLSVTDGGSAATPAVRAVGPDSVDGRGLAIVAALTRRWGVEREPHGQRVWAELGAPVGPT